MTLAGVFIAYLAIKKVAIQSTDLNRKQLRQGLARIGGAHERLAD